VSTDQKSGEPDDSDPGSQSGRGGQSARPGDPWKTAQEAMLQAAGSTGPTLRLGLPRLPARSLGLKFILVCLLALLMTIPTLFVSGIVGERAARAAQVSQELGAQTGGLQQVSGPVLLVPFSREVITEVPGDNGPRRARTIERGQWAIFAATGKADATLAVTTRARSIYKVPVFLADTTFEATFDVPAALQGMPANVTLDWSGARLMAWAGDLRGVRDVLQVTLEDGAVRSFEPGGEGLVQTVQHATGEAVAAASVDRPAETGMAPSLPGQSVLADVSGVMGPETKTTVRMAMKLSGAERFSIAAFAQDTTATIRGNWDDPGFEGAFLASERRIGNRLLSETGPPRSVDGEPGTFEATWRAPFLARGLPRGGEVGGTVSFGQVADRDFAVTLVQRSEVYAGVQRAVRYALLFVSTVFLAYFLFEAMGGSRAHPAQYLLVGLAQSVFYLLLLAFAEQIGFDLAFLLAAAPTVILSAAYAGSVFRSRKQGIQAFFAFAAVYGLMYVLMTLEDQALLAGALTAFGAIAAVMWLTRKVNWYGDRTSQENTAPG
jgi:inner membrane protein